MSVSYVARRAGIAPSQLFAWKRRMLEGGTAAVQADDDVVAAARVRELEKRVRDLERVLGRKTMEAEILREALELATPKKRMARPDCKGFLSGFSVCANVSGLRADGRPRPRWSFRAYRSS